MDKPYLAHRREDTGEEQLLIDHLRGTAELAGARVRLAPDGTVTTVMRPTGSG